MTTLTTNTITMDFLTSKSMTKIFDFELFKVRNQDKEDVRQDCVIRIMTALKKQSVDVDKLPSFCQTVIKRTVVDYYRKTNRMIDKNSTSVFFCDGFADDGGSDEGNDMSFSATTEESGYDLIDIRLDFSLNRHRFTPTEQEVIEFMLNTEEGMSMNLAEIATELHINKSHTTRAFKKLREMYGA